MLNRVLAIVIACCAMCVPSFAGECRSDADCVVASKQSTAGVCESWGSESRCDHKSVPWIVTLSGDVHTFCRAYVHGCSNASLTLSKDGRQVRVTIKGPGAFKEKSCTLEVALDDSAVEAGTADRIADGIEACVHNAPVYFYRTMKKAVEGVAYCCGYPF
jgi:hypothetical protein